MAARRQGAPRSLVRRTTVSIIVVATAVTAIIGLTGSTAAAHSSHSKSKVVAAKKKAVIKARPAAKEQAVAHTRRRRPIRTPAPVVTSPAPVVTSPAPVVTSPAPVVTSPAPVVTSPAPVVTSPAPVVTSPAPVVTPIGTPTVPKAGLPAGTVLRSMSGMNITVAGTVIDGADISGGVRVNAANVVIRRSKIDGVGMAGIYVQSGSLTVEDTTITGFDTSLAGGNYTATRVEVTKGFSDGFKIGSNVVIQDSWCHDMTPAPGAHADCGQVQSGVENVTIRRNWFDVGNVDGNAALFLAPDLGPSSPGPMLIENNVLGGGNFTLQCVDGNNGDYFIDSITIRNNEFLRNSNYGPMRINVPAVVTGNTYQDTKQAI